MTAASAAAAALTSRDSRTARARSAASGGPAVAQQPALLGPAVVDVLAAEPDAQRPGEGSLAAAGVRAGMLAAVAAQASAARAGGCPPTAGASAAASSPVTPGRDQVGRVVEPGRGPAEPLVARAVVADHRVERVDRAVAEQAGQAGDGAPQQRRDHRVGGVLGDRLHRRAGQPGRVAAGPGRVRTARAAAAGRRAGRRPPGPRPMAWASRARLVPPSTAQVASAVTARWRTARPRASCPASRPRPPGPGRRPPWSIPRPRLSAQSAASARDAAAAERRDRVPAARIGEHGVERRAEQQPGGQAAPRRHHQRNLPRDRFLHCRRTERKTGDHSPRYPSTCAPPHPTWAPSARLTRVRGFGRGGSGSSGHVSDAARGATIPAQEPDRPGETEAQRDDRNVMELLNELRVVGIGVQVLFGFLLSLPFTSRFARLDPAQRGVYLATVTFAAMSIALLVAPVAYHRLLFRRHEKREPGPGDQRAGHRRAGHGGARGVLRGPPGGQFRGAGSPRPW